jgi:hypothetical protein
MSTPQVIAILDAVASGNESLTRELASRSDVAITHLMLACKDLCDTTELARQCSRVTPANRKNVFIDALASVAIRNNSPIVQQEQQSVAVAEEQAPADLPFEPAAVEVPQVEKPARRRRSSLPLAQEPAVVVQEVEQVPVVEHVVETVSQQVHTTDINVQVEALNGALVSISHNFSKLLASNSEILNRVSAIDQGVSSDLKYINASLDQAQRIDADFQAKVAKSNASTEQRLNDLADKLDTLIQSVEKFRLGTEALEIELIAKGILESAPFADSWANS